MYKLEYCGCTKAIEVVPITRATPPALQAAYRYPQVRYEIWVAATIALPISSLTFKFYHNSRSLEV